MIHVKGSKYYKSDSVFKVGVYGVEVTPVPIPNTEVKLIRVDDTWLVTARETKSVPTLTKDCKCSPFLFEPLAVSLPASTKCQS